jgi:hypothetical protein
VLAPLFIETPDEDSGNEIGRDGGPAIEQQIEAAAP